jgi:hypothetical protein
MNKAVLLFILPLLLVSCQSVVRTPSPEAPPAAVTSISTPTLVHEAASATIIQSTVSPSATVVESTVSPTAPALIITPAAGSLFSDPAIGISFIYPQGWEILPRAPDDPPGMTLHAPAVGAGPEPIIFAITLVIDPVAEKSVKEVVDQQLGQIPSDLQGGVERKSTTVGGETAEEVTGLPSQQGALETFVLHGGQLFLIILQPYDLTNESLLPYLPQMRSAYGSLLSSWKFLN